MKLVKNAAFVVGMPLVLLLSLTALTLIFQYIYIKIKGPLVDDTLLTAK